MIDLHCHLLPGIDDGAPDLDTALQMAAIAVEDGITTTACTPHIYPGLFENTAEGINRAVSEFRAELDLAGIPLTLTVGADIQIVPELVEGLQSGRLPTLGHSRYFLFEPPHHIAPPGMLDLLHNVLTSGFVPVITHPERLTYVEDYYDRFIQAAQAGAWLQLTGGSLVGRFGPQAQRVAERFLRDGVTHLLASDGHNLGNRAPRLAEARVAAAVIVGEDEARRLVEDRPRAILDDLAPTAIEAPVPVQARQAPGLWARSNGWLGRLFSHGG